MPDDPAVTTPSKRMPRGMFQLRLPFLMVLVAGSALVNWAWQFRDANRDVRRSFTRIQIHDLANGKPFIRRFAAESLSDTSPDELGLVLPALAFGTRDADADVRRAAIRSLRRVIPRAAESRQGAVSDEIAVVTPLLISALKDKDPRVRAEAAGALKGLQGEIVLKKTSTVVHFGPDPRRVLPAMVEAMNDPAADVRREAISAFDHIASPSEDAPPALIAAMTDDPDASVRAMATSNLRRPWRNPQALWSPLLKLLRSTDDHLRSQAIEGLWKLGQPAPPSAVPALLEALDSEDLTVNWIVLHFVAKFGPAARPALPKLLALARGQMKKAVRTKQLPAEDLLTNQHGRSRGPSKIVKLQVPAVAAIIAIDPQSPEAQAIVESLASPEWTVHGMLPDIAGRFGSTARSALPKLLPLARDEMNREGVFHQFMAVDAIIAIDPDSAEARSLLAPLVDRLRHPKHGGADIPPALVSLVKFGKSAAPVKPALVDALQDRSPIVREHAAHILAVMESSDRETEDSAEPIPPEKP